MEIMNIFGVLIGLTFFVFLIWLYIYYCKRIIKMAREVGLKENLWLVYIPLARGYILCKMSKTQTWTFWVPSTLFVLYFLMAISNWSEELLSIIISIFYIFTLVVSLVWGWRICRKFNYSGWWTLIFNLWVLFMETKEEQKSMSKKEKEQIEHYKKHKSEIEKKDNEEFIKFLKIIGIIFVLIILALLVRWLFF